MKDTAALGVAAISDMLDRDDGRGTHPRALSMRGCGCAGGPCVLLSFMTLCMHDRTRGSMITCKYCIRYCRWVE